MNALLDSDRETLETQRERLLLVLEGTRLGMWDWNPQTGDVIFDERWAQMLGHSLDEIEFNLDSWSSRVHPEDLPRCIADIQAHIDGRIEWYENVHRMRHKDGHWVHILDRGRIVSRDAEGQVTRFTGTHTDITAQCEAEQRAKELARARTRFLAMMSHEIRTPLHGMLGVVELLCTTPLSPEQEHLLGILKDSSDTLLVLINDILDFARIDDGELKIAAEDFDVRALVESVAALFRPRALQKRLTFVCELRPGLGDFARGDAHRVRQILCNLLSNATKFTAHGSVSLSASREGEELVFEVSDTGPGIDDTERIFHVFEQEEASASENGVGLGLSITRRLAEGMGGSISVESKRGVGSRFSVRVRAPESAAPDRELPQAHLRQAQMRVLVADDNPINQLVLRTRLANAGHYCETVDTGAQACDAALGAHWDCVFLDLHMPELSGEEVAKRLRDAGFRGRLVAASADVMLETQARCMAGGFDDFMAKPFSQEELIGHLGPRIEP